MTKLAAILSGYACATTAAGPASSIKYATYLGGANKDCAKALAVDAFGATYIAGSTPSSNFPVTPGAFISKSRVKNDDWIGFLVKLDASGTKRVYSTLVGGNYRTTLAGVAVDATGSAAVVGATCSSDLPTSSTAWIGKAPGGGKGVESCDGFLIALTAAGERLRYGTYIGGSGSDSTTSVAMDNSGAAYVVGQTLSSDFPVTSRAMQPKRAGGSDGFLVKLDLNSGRVVYSTYIGGSGDEAITSIRLGKEGAVYVAGTTSSRDFPYEKQKARAEYDSDVFVLRLELKPEHTARGYRIAAHGDDQLGSMDLDAGGDVYLAGTKGTGDGFVVRLDGRRLATDKDPVQWFSSIGGSSNDSVRSISTGIAGSVWVSGWTGSTDFPTTPSAWHRRLLRNHDGFVAQLRAGDGRLLFASFVGGGRYRASPYNDVAHATVAVPAGDVFLAGCTHTSELPVTRSAVQPTSGGNSDPFVMRFQLLIPPAKPLF